MLLTLKWSRLTGRYICGVGERRVSVDYFSNGQVPLTPGYEFIEPLGAYRQCRAPRASPRQVVTAGFVVTAPDNHGHCRAGVVVKYEWLLGRLKAEHLLQQQGRHEQRAVHAKGVR